MQALQGSKPGAATVLRRLVLYVLPKRGRQDPLLYYQVELVVVFCMLGVLLTLSFGVYYAVALRSVAAGALLWLVGAVVAAIPLTARWTGSTALAANLLAFMLLLSSSATAWLRGGFALAAISYTIPIPLVTTYLAGRRATWLWTLIAVGTTAVFFFRSQMGLAPAVLSAVSPSKLELLDGLGLVGLISLVAILGWSYRRSRDAVERERHRTTAQLEQSQRLESVGQLAAGVAHDFNNILSVILSTTSTLLHGVRSGDRCFEDEELGEDIEQIDRACRRGADLTRQLLAFSRRDLIRPEVLDINALLASSRLMTRALRDNIHLQLFTATSLWHVKVDPRQLERVLINLATNARDAMPDGGTFTIETANLDVSTSETELAPRTPPAGHWVVLTAKDNGLGIQQDVLHRIFEPFFTTKGSARGTGLGLATAYGIIKQARGHITADSQVGVGTVFKIYLPATDEPLSQSRPEASGKIRLRTERRETILLVEDEAPVRRAVRRSLESNGYRVVEAKSGEEAVELACDLAYDLLLTDVIMTGMSGPRLADTLAVTHPNARVLFMTGYANDAIAEHGVLHDDVRLLEKPFEIGDLLRSVQEVLVLNETLDSSPGQ
ncbi:response regulator [Myxococcota bacterium]